MSGGDSLNGLVAGPRTDPPPGFFNYNMNAGLYYLHATRVPARTPFLLGYPRPQASFIRYYIFSYLQQNAFCDPAKPGDWLVPVTWDEVNQILKDGFYVDLQISKDYGPCIYGDLPFPSDVFLQLLLMRGVLNANMDGAGI